MNGQRPRSTRKGVKIVAIVGGSIVALAATLLVVVLIAGGILAPATYREPWDEEYAARFDDPRMQLVARAVLAPSSHNEQPWRVRLDEADENVLYLYTDSHRLTPEVDPLARQTMISQGTFLEYLVIAGRHLGTDVTIELFPDGTYDEADLPASMDELPVARIVLSPRSDANSDDYASLFLSDTNRGPYAPIEVTAEQASDLEALATTTGLTLTVYRDREDVSAIGAATVRGTVIESENQAVAAESARIFRSNEYRKNETRSGFAVEGQGTDGFMKYLLQGLTTLLPGTNSAEAAAERDVALATNGAAHTPAYIVLETAGNTRIDQVRSGMLYAQVSLRARSMGLVVQPVSQVLEEYPSMRAERAAIHSAYATDGGTIQMLVRLGTPTVDYPPTMRRDAGDLLVAKR